VGGRRRGRLDGTGSTKHNIPEPRLATTMPYVLNAIRRFRSQRKHGEGGPDAHFRWAQIRCRNRPDGKWLGLVAGLGFGLDPS
jgi:hypothetical protein